jgi:hypothetical protein
MSSARTLSEIAAALLVLGCLTSGAAAAVRISGNAERLMLEVENASIGEVLAALRQALPIRVSVIGGTARTFTGTYSGSLRGVLKRLLSGDDHDFFLAMPTGGLQLTLLDRKPGGVVAVMATVDDLADANDPSLVALAAAAAQGGGSRDSRSRQQRLQRFVGTVDPY